ncbi:MAG: hypothetical protein J6E49_05610 [Acidaminococcaceae bacterium]|jgi:hypothetical protein|uniref:hypothetical protein n=1 Tax=Succiniclasticum sp. TaxID=2775030 RepID=UPI000E8A9C60|nr:hypothetical protein [Succiniclasticum sp.]MBO5590080.1 hypothetical protein [Acidaminococcaceae bacterium]MBO5637804.1 hypothetical protein [Acidaminococcaceae bacterium]MBP3812571.1 hypothetical protein [Acidaminococcaceae bacterium]MBR1493813.1 hypothetical protein [Acidaminococcaceae bacterium]MBR1661371.1 hypothetical protein [Acidaminococcaceae bacterium]
MNKKAEQFKAFLDERKVEAFQMEEVEGNEQHAVVFRSFIGVEGQQLPTVVIADDSVFSIIRVQIAPQALNEESAAELMKFINEQNALYKPFKLFFDEPGNLMMDACLMAENDELKGEIVYQMYNVIINYLNENYRNIMKVVWR